MKTLDLKYVLLNKPAGYVSALKDNLSPTILELVKEDIKGLHIVGRLDKDTTGLIILTNDGAYTHVATHPKKHVSKVYEVSLKNDVSASDLATIESGMLIDHGKTKLKPAKVKAIDERKVQLSISEGKFHQVKKMFAALDNEVIKLCRIEFDNIKLSDLDIKEGEYIIVDSINQMGYNY